MPLDVIGMAEILQRIEAAAAADVPYLISTINLNFLINSQLDQSFKRSLLESDLCPADGAPIVWVARLLGIPIRDRVAGSDMFDALKSERRPEHPLKVFLFGAAEGIAAAASKAINARSGGLTCVGAVCPGFGSVAEMSGNALIDTINSSGADFLAVSLGAKKGQAWLQENHSRLRVPVRSHLGATINFQAGTVKRASSGFRKLGLEWLWRIKEEPYLWRRYAHDGAALLKLLLTRVLPLVFEGRWRQFRYGETLDIRRSQQEDGILFTLSGAATAQHIDRAIIAFREALAVKKPIRVDLTGVRVIDARFLGLMLMLVKKAQASKTCLTIAGVSSYVARVLRLNSVDLPVASKGIA